MGIIYIYIYIYTHTYIYIYIYIMGWGLSASASDVRVGYPVPPEVLGRRRGTHDHGNEIVVLVTSNGNNGNND